jgi:hypothetical protein
MSGVDGDDGLWGFSEQIHKRGCIHRSNRSVRKGALNLASRRERGIVNMEPMTRGDYFGGLRSALRVERAMRSPTRS